MRQESCFCTSMIIPLHCCHSCVIATLNSDLTKDIQICCSISCFFLLSFFFLFVLRSYLLYILFPIEQIWIISFPLSLLLFLFCPFPQVSHLWFINSDLFSFSLSMPRSLQLHGAPHLSTLFKHRHTRRHNHLFISRTIRTIPKYVKGQKRKRQKNEEKGKS